jgi:UDP-glucose 4-epimerase
MNILLTGGAGFIGSHVLRAYLDEGHDVAVLDDLSVGRREAVPEGVSFFECDICDESALWDVMAFVRPEVVNHHAGLVCVRESAEIPEKYMAVNTQGTENVLRAAQKVDVKTFIFASSGGAVYGEAQHLPVNEDHPLNPISPYGESKALAERILGSQDGQFKVVILRYGNVYGPGQDPGHGSGAISIFARALGGGEPVTIFGNGDQVRDYVYVKDAARANLHALGMDEGDIFNIGTGQGRNLLQIGTHIAAEIGVDFETQHQAVRLYEVRTNILDVSRAASGLDWCAEIPFEEGLIDTLRWLGVLLKGSSPVSKDD